MVRQVTLVPRGPNGELPGEYDSEEESDSDWINLISNNC